uniref:Uncharacterized protein n=1 Tax=Arundo donax TaxID=35708 RepID=A0A0A9F6C7_ARUDO
MLHTLDKQAHLWQHRLFGTRASASIDFEHTVKPSEKIPLNWIAVTNQSQLGQHLQRLENFQSSNKKLQGPRSIAQPMHNNAYALYTQK